MLRLDPHFSANTTGFKRFSYSRSVHTQPLSAATTDLMCLAIAGLRSISSLPVSLKANWVLQVAQLSPPERYIAATRRAMLLMATIPVWATAAGLSLCYRPWDQVAEHLLVLAFAGSIMTDVTLIGMSKIPFACSYLPGKSNVRFMFWVFVIVFIPLAMMFSHYEQSVSITLLRMHCSSRFYSLRH